MNLRYAIVRFWFAAHLVLLVAEDERRTALGGKGVTFARDMDGAHVIQSRTSRVSLDL